MNNDNTWDTLDCPGQPGPRSFWYSGGFATPAEWEADLLRNGNYARFCQQLGMTYVSHTESVAHYTNVNEGGNGYFYNGWYYAGPKFCPSDLHYAGDGDPNSGYNVWQYSGSCGCCITTSEWSFERRAFIECL